MTQKLVLIGGGHAHAIALKQWGLDPLLDVELILISNVEQTPYSGMLPGHVAGFYSYKETHIDLRSLARFAGAKLIIDRAIGIDTENNEVICQHHRVRFDYLSLDIGSTPQTIAIAGAREYAIPAKPVPVFLDAWYRLKQSIVDHPHRPRSIAIVGGGAGGVELALNMQAGLRAVIGENSSQIQFHLVHRGRELLASHNGWVSHKLKKILTDRGVRLHLEQSVVEVQSDRVICQSGLEIKSDRVFWVTQAAAPDWIKQSDLATDEHGFMLVSNTLQSVSHPHILAAGDIATMTDYHRPKAGVFAVRQGKPLFNNWQSLIRKQPLQAYIPQTKYLALIGTGDRRAIASWGSWGWRSRIFWWLKDYIDRQFMNQFPD